VAWIAGGVSFFIVLAAVMVVGAIVLVWVLPKIRKMKRIEEVQLDILARPGNDSPVIESVTETLLDADEVEPGRKGTATESFASSYNPYS
jgi:hypothetical protein